MLVRTSHRVSCTLPLFLYTFICSVRYSFVIPVFFVSVLSFFFNNEKKIDVPVMHAVTFALARYMALAFYAGDRQPHTWWHFVRIERDFECPRELLNILTYLLTLWCRVLLEKLTGLQLVKKFPAFHGTRRFITALTSVRHLTLSWTSPIQSIYPHSTSWRSILILSTHLHLGLPSGLFHSGFPTKTLYTPLSSPIRATCPAHLIPHVSVSEQECFTGRGC